MPATGGDFPPAAALPCTSYLLAAASHSCRACMQTACHHINVRFPRGGCGKRCMCFTILFCPEEQWGPRMIGNRFSKRQNELGTKPSRSLCHSLHPQLSPCLPDVNPLLSHSQPPRPGQQTQQTDTGHTPFGPAVCPLPGLHTTQTAGGCTLLPLSDLSASHLMLPPPSPLLPGVWVGGWFRVIGHRLQTTYRVWLG